MVQWTLPGEPAGGESKTPMWPDSCAWCEGCIGSVLRVGLMGKRTGQDRTAASRGARHGPEGPEGPLLRPRERTCVPSSRMVSAQGAGDAPPSWPGMEETAPGPRDA